MLRDDDDDEREDLGVLQTRVVEYFMMMASSAGTECSLGAPGTGGAAHSCRMVADRQRTHMTLPDALHLLLPSRCP